MPGHARRNSVGVRAAVVVRVWQAAQKQVEEIERRMTNGGLSLAERESDARVLASMARALRDLSVIDEGSKPGEELAADERPPRDLDELREALARKLDEFAASSSRE